MQTPQWFSYTGCYVVVDDSPKFLPRIELNAHAEIVNHASFTTLTQGFNNPNASSLDQVQYMFPLYDGVSVVGFTCFIGGNVIKGIVKEREAAREEFNNAVQRGKAAGLMQQHLLASDVFTASIGNIPAGESVKIVIKYLGELKHDAEVDGLRYTLPTGIAPRYSADWSLALTLDEKWLIKGDISVTIDVEMPNDSPITSIQSPSHPISVDIGKRSNDPPGEPCLRKASVNSSLAATELGNDFVICITAGNIGNPTALLETHPTLPSQALMTTLVPKFNVPNEKPEVVFICDRSGSMQAHMAGLRAALQIFIKSLPVGIKFNLCSFGSSCSFLWERSRAYNSESLDQAVEHIQSFQADYGGTEMYEPVQEAIKRRLLDSNLELFILTDGEIWQQQQLFGLIREHVVNSEGRIRVFSLGIGAGVSHALVEGIARAGNGFSQSVGPNEKMDRKIIRMLRGALTPHVKDYSLEVKYELAEGSSEDYEFEVVEAGDVVIVENTGPSTTAMTKVDTIQKTSLFDSEFKDPYEETTENADSRLSLPTVRTPRYLQTPFDIPPLFPFDRTTVYILLSDNPSRQPKSVLLKATSLYGPLELEIPVTITADKSTIIHQLAARKAIQELEEGRGWIFGARGTDERLLKDTCSCFSDLVQREAVRLGVMHQVAGKWTSFVAVESSDTTPDGIVKTVEPVFNQVSNLSGPGMAEWDVDEESDGDMDMGFGLFDGPDIPVKTRSTKKSAASPQPVPDNLIDYSDESDADMGFGLFDGLDTPVKSQPIRDKSAPSPQPVPDHSAEYSDGSDADMGFESFDTDIPKSTSATEIPADHNTAGPLLQLVHLQGFLGYWEWSSELEALLGVTQEQASKCVIAQIPGSQGRVLATLCTVVYLKKRLASERDTWDMFVEKACNWLRDETGGPIERLEQAVEVLF